MLKSTIFYLVTTGIKNDYTYKLSSDLKACITPASTMNALPCIKGTSPSLMLLSLYLRIKLTILQVIEVAEESA